MCSALTNFRTIYRRGKKLQQRRIGGCPTKTTISEDRTNPVKVRKEIELRALQRYQGKRSILEIEELQSQSGDALGNFHLPTGKFSNENDLSPVKRSP